VDLITSKPNFQNSNLFSGNGFLYIQKIIADNILAMKTGEDTSEIEVFMTSGFTNAFIRDDFMEGIGQTFPLFILLVFLAPIYRLVGFVVSEKASRSREGMKMMGLNDAPYWLSWFIYYFSICLMISLSVSVLFTIFLFKNSSFILLFLYFVLYGMSLFSFNLVI
jgi:ATP-binding cassette subfamily A (ABC1) protein 3